MWVKNFSTILHHKHSFNVILWSTKKKQIFSYKICMPFVWIILIKGRLTNQFFLRNVLWTFLRDPPLLLPRNVSGLKSLKIDFFDLDWAHRRAKSRYGFDLLRSVTCDPVHYDRPILDSVTSSEDISSSSQQQIINCEKQIFFSSQRNATRRNPLPPNCNSVYL